MIVTPSQMGNYKIADNRANRTALAITAGWHAHSLGGPCQKVMAWSGRSPEEQDEPAVPGPGAVASHV